MPYIYEWMQLLFFFILLIILSPVLGRYIAFAIEADINSLPRPLSLSEKFIYSISGVNANKEMGWKQYTVSMLLFNLMGFVLLLAIELLQNHLPLNPQRLPAVEPFLAFNTAVSFVTNTNWQAYAGETTMSYFTQMAGLTVQNFLSAATGMAVLFALVRGLSRRSSSTLGNFYRDMTRSAIYILLPLSAILAIVLVSQGAVQTFSPYIHIHTLEGIGQTVPLGPAASQIAIKQLGTNGGGFFNANSAFPYENPTPLSNFLEVFAILLIPSSLVFTYGSMTGRKRQAWVIFGVMLVLLIAGLSVSLLSEFSYNPLFKASGIMEGKEVRFGIIQSILWSVVTTAASSGSVNSMISSLSPMAGMISMLNMQLGEIVFGGAGSGLYGMMLFILLTVFISGLMVGRTPEFMGKKIESFEIKWTIIAVLVPGIVILIFTALALVTPAGLCSTSATGPHGFSEILYAFSSSAGNNGSAFAGLNANTHFYNLLTALAMLAGRFAVIIPVMMIAGSMAGKNITPESAGTLHTDTWLFAVLLTGIIIIVGALTFFPALALGPVLEHLLISRGMVF